MFITGNLPCSIETSRQIIGKGPRGGCGAHGGGSDLEKRRGSGDYKSLEPLSSGTHEALRSSPEGTMRSSARPLHFLQSLSPPDGSMGRRIVISRESCSDCGICAEICPNRIIGRSQSRLIEAREDRLSLCFTCGQCMARLSEV
ncbi:MAG: 4Fe-4S dicluster domain-containing protein [Rectinemataceae bacterium]